MIVGTATRVPSHAYSQAQMLALVDALFPTLATSGSGKTSRERLEDLFDAVGVRQRHLALSIDRYLALDGFGDRSRAWIEVAQRLGEQVVRGGLAAAKLDAGSIALLATTTVTGVAVPTLDARLMNRIAFAPTLERVPMFGLGCVGGAAGIARVADYLRAYPDQAAMLVSVELCSLTLQRDDPSMANLISTGLFGDGAAAVVLVGGAHPLAASSQSTSGAKPAVIDTRATFFAQTESLMGWDMVDTGFKIVLGRGVPDLVAAELAGFVDPFLACHGLDRDAIETWIAHPGGPKVIRAVQDALDLDDEQLAATRESLAEYGNMSSASVLFVLDEVVRHRRPAPGSYGLLFALGPAFCAELVLLRW